MIILVTRSTSLGWSDKWISQPPWVSDQDRSHRRDDEFDENMASSNKLGSHRRDDEFDGKLASSKKIWSHRRDDESKLWQRWKSRHKNNLSWAAHLSSFRLVSLMKRKFEPWQGNPIEEVFMHKFSNINGFQSLELWTKSWEKAAKGRKVAKGTSRDWRLTESWVKRDNFQSQ